MKNKKVEVLRDFNEIREVEVATAQKTGVIYADKYISLVKDAVRFPNGSLGTYIRFVESDKSKKGCVILPVINGKKIVLLRHWRHAPQKWVYEIPRGFGTPGLDIEANAQKELREEIGVEAKNIHHIGDVYPDTGLFEKEVSVMVAEISEEQSRHLLCQDETEAISDFIVCSLDELKDMTQKGLLKDGFTFSAIGMAMMAGKLK